MRRAGQVVREDLDGGPMLRNMPDGSRFLGAPGLPGDDLRLGAANPVDTSARQHCFVMTLDELVFQRGRTEVRNENSQGAPPWQARPGFPRSLMRNSGRMIAGPSQF